MIPTIKQVCNAYQFYAVAERMKTGRPGEYAVANTLSGITTLRRALGFSLDAPLTIFTRQLLDRAIVIFMNRGVSRVTALTYLQQLQALLAKWTRPYYADAGWEIPEIEFPVFRAQAPRYQRPSPELLRAVKAWYEQLPAATDAWLAATMMLEFAMRNGDVLRLKRTHFVSRPPSNERPGGQFISYTPHKTALSSRRRVLWPIHDAIWQNLQPFFENRPPDEPLIDDDPFPELNRQLRTLGFHGAKASYELRKICIDHVYQRFGAEMASSISGDDLKTLTYYYADPAQPNVGNIRIIELL